VIFVTDFTGRILFDRERFARPLSAGRYELEGAIYMQRRAVVMIPVFLALASSIASAQTVRLEQYQHPSEPKFQVFNRLYLAGVRDGLMAYSVRRGAKDPVFCLPPDLVLTTEQAEDIMLRTAEKRHTLGSTPIGVPLLLGLAETYPCDAKPAPPDGSE
jgi:hypothetical protein